MLLKYSKKQHRLLCVHSELYKRSNRNLQVDCLKNHPEWNQTEDKLRRHNHEEKLTDFYVQVFLIYYSNFDNDHFIDCHRSQCNEPTLLAHDNFGVFSSISTNYAAVIAIASSYRFKLQITLWMVQCMPFAWRNAKYCFYRKVHSFQMVIILSRTSHISYKRVSTEYWKVKNVFIKHILYFWYFNINLNFWVEILKTFCSFRHTHGTV